MYVSLKLYCKTITLGKFNCLRPPCTCVYPLDLYMYTHIHTHLNIYNTINTFDMALSAFNRQIYLPCLYKFIFIV